MEGATTSLFRWRRDEIRRISGIVRWEYSGLPDLVLSVESKECLVYAALNPDSGFDGNPLYLPASFKGAERMRA